MSGNAVDWILVFHLAGIILWFTGLLMAITAAPTSAALAQKGLRKFAHPGAGLVVITGVILMLLLPELRMAAWLHAKLTLVVILIAVDLVLTFRLRRQPAEQPSASFLGMISGLVGLLLVLILILVLVKPF
ncbi:MAG TPA: CopD family protein [Terriglobales bacterium]|jgi:putative membrane protein